MGVVSVAGSEICMSIILCVVHLAKKILMVCTLVDKVSQFPLDSSRYITSSLATSHELSAFYSFFVCFKDLTDPFLSFT